jgi:hypothetical protein
LSPLTANFIEIWYRSYFPQGKCILFFVAERNFPNVGYDFLHDKALDCLASDPSIKVITDAFFAEVYLKSEKK